MKYDCLGHLNLEEHGFAGLSYKRPFTPKRKKFFIDDSTYIKGNYHNKSSLNLLKKNSEKELEKILQSKKKLNEKSIE